MSGTVTRVVDEFSEANGIETSAVEVEGAVEAVTEVTTRCICMLWYSCRNRCVSASGL